MASTFETVAVLKLLDELTGPLAQAARKVGQVNTQQQRGFESHVARMGDLGRKMTFAVTLPMVEMSKKLVEVAREQSRVENDTTAVLMQKARALGMAETAARAYANTQLALIRKSSTDAYEGKNGLPPGAIDPLEYRRSELAAIKAGYDDEASEVAKQSAILAGATHSNQAEANDYLIQFLNATQAATRNETGHPLEAPELSEVIGRYTTALVTAMNSSNYKSLAEAAESLKLSAPLAKAVGFDFGQLIAMSAAQKESGFGGGESGVAQRSFEMSLVHPKASAYAAWDQAHVHLRDFQHFDPTLSSEGQAKFEKQLRDRGYKIAQGGLDKAFGDFRANGNVDALAQGVADQVMATGSAKHPLKPATVNALINRILETFVDGVDGPGLVAKARAEGKVTPAILAQTGEGRQAPRLMPFLNPPKDLKARDEYANEMARQYGPNWQMMQHEARKFSDQPTPQEFQHQQAAKAQRVLDEQLKGFDGSMIRIGHAITEMGVKLGDEHVFDDIASDVVMVVDAIARLNPATLRYAADAAMAATALGPLIWGLTSIATVSTGAVRGLMAANRWLRATEGAAEGAARGAGQAAKAFGGVSESAVKSERAVAQASRNLAAAQAEDAKGVAQAAERVMLEQTRAMQQMASQMGEGVANAAKGSLDRIAANARAAQAAFEQAASGTEAAAGRLSGSAARATAAWDKLASDLVSHAEQSLQAGGDAVAQQFARLEQSWASSGGKAASDIVAANDQIASSLEAYRSAAAEVPSLTNALAEAERLEATAKTAATEATRNMTAAVKEQAKAMNELSAQKAALDKTQAKLDKLPETAPEPKTPAAQKIYDDAAANNQKVVADAMGQLGKGVFAPQNMAQAGREIAGGVIKGGFWTAFLDVLQKQGDNTSKSFHPDVYRHVKNERAKVDELTAQWEKQLGVNGYWSQLLLGGPIGAAAGVYQGVQDIPDDVRRAREWWNDPRPDSEIRASTRAWHEFQGGSPEASHGRAYDDLNNRRGEQGPQLPKQEISIDPQSGFLNPKPVTVTGEMSGKVDLMNKIVVEPSLYLLGKLAQMEQGIQFNMAGSLGPTLGPSMSGSNGAVAPTHASPRFN